MFNSILLPIDLSAEASWAKAAPIAIKMAREGGAKLHVITVLPDVRALMVSQYFDDSFEKDAMHRVGEELSAWVAEHVPAGIDVHPHVLLGSVYDEILQAADRLDVDAIVMGSHRPELKDYLLGPNAARVVRHANQSVFVVRGDA